MPDRLRIAGTVIDTAGPNAWDRETLTIVQSAYDGQIGNGSVYVRDDATRSFKGGREIRFTYHYGEDDAAVIIDGFLGEQERVRPEDDVAVGHRGNAYNIRDANAILAHRRVTNWKRPAETDVARIKAAIAEFAPGLSTSEYVPNTNTVTMPKNKYDGVFLDDIFQDAMELSGKTWFVDNAREVHYHQFREDVGFNAPIAIVGDGGANLIDEFPPIDPRRRADPYDLSNNIRVEGSKSHVTVTDSGSIADHDADGLKHQDVLQFQGGTGAMTAYANAILGERKDERPMWACRLGPFPDPSILQAGMLISVTSEIMGLSGQFERIAELSWTTSAPDVWWADLEIGNPKRLAARRRRHPRGPKTAGLEKGEEISVLRWCNSFHRGRLQLAGAFKYTDLADSYDFAGPDGPIHREITQDAYPHNIPWTAGVCPLGLGGWGGWKIEEQWFEFNPGSLAGSVGLIFTFEINPPVGETVVGGAAQSYGFHYGIAQAVPPPYVEEAYALVGKLPGGTGSYEVVIPASLVVPSVSNYFVVSAAWRCFPAAGTWACSNDVPNLNEAPKYGIGLSGNARISDKPTCHKASVIGSGDTTWVSGYGTTDGVNTTYELVDWNGKGIPGARVGNVLLAVDIDYTYDEDAGTVTLKDPAAVGSNVAFRYSV